MKSMLFSNQSGRGMRWTETVMTSSIHLAFEGGPPLTSAVQSWSYSLAHPDTG